MAEPSETERIAILLELKKAEFEKNARSAGSAIDRLERKFDPLGAAEQRLERQQKKLNAALQAGTLDAARHQKGMDLLQREFDQTKAKIEGTTDSLRRMNAVQGDVGGVLARNKGAFQQLGYQVGDAAVQIQGGTSAAVALTQQGSQMLGVFGPMGAIMGAALAVGVPLAASFMDLGDDAEDSAEDVQTFADRLAAAQGAMERADAAMKLASAGGVEDLRQIYGQVTQEITDLADALEEIEVRAAKVEASQLVDKILPDVEGTAEQLRAAFADYEANVARLNEVNAQLMGVSSLPQEDFDRLDAERQQLEGILATLVPIRGQIEAIATEMDIWPEDASALAVGLASARDALNAGDYSGAAAQLADMRHFAESLGLTLSNEVVVAITNSESFAREMANRFGDAQANAAGTAAAASGIVGPVSAAANEAGRLSGNLATAMANLASVTSGIAAAQRRAATAARIALEYAGDPVGRAGAETRAELNEASGAAAYELIRSGGSSRLGGIAATNDELVAGAQDVARLEQQAEAAEAAAREAEQAAAKKGRVSSKGGGSKGGRSTGGASSAEKAAKEILKTGDAYRSLLASLDPVAAATQRFEKAQETVNEALSAGQIGSEDASRAMELAREQMEESIRAADELGQSSREGAEYLSNMFMGIVDGSMSAKDAIRQLLLQLAQVQMQRAFLGMADGGGVLGSLFGALGGALSPTPSIGSNASGTDYWRGGLTRVNEMGGEIMNLPRGTQIIPHDISKRMVDRAAGGPDRGGAIEVRVSLDGKMLKGEIVGTAGPVAVQLIEANNEKLAQTQRRT